MSTETTAPDEVAALKAELARLRNGAQQLGKIVTWQAQSMQAARIEMIQNGPEAAMQWILNAYTLCISALLLLGGAAADQFGRRRVFLIGITIFAIASVGCGLAPHIAVLILARAIQGVGAALLIPCSLALIGAAYNEKADKRSWQAMQDFFAEIFATK